MPNPKGRPKVVSGPCEFDGCDRDAVTVGPPSLCKTHYEQRRTGRALAPIGRHVVRGRGTPCSVDGCVRPHHANGLCQWHEQRRRAGNPLNMERIRSRRGGRPRCAADGCDQLASGKGYCPRHYQAWRTYGDPLVRNVKLPPEAIGNGWSRPEKNRFYNYGIRPDQFAAFLADQNDGCAICRTADPGIKGWIVDHCHESGHVRALLCSCCNRALGLLNDDPAVLRAAARYLEGHRQLRLFAHKGSVG